MAVPLLWNASSRSSSVNQPEVVGVTDARRLVDPQTHEVVANLNWNTDGLRPYFALAAATGDGDGAAETTITVDDRAYTVQLWYSEGKLVPPESGVTPGGSRWNVGTTDGHVREFRLDVEAANNELRSVHYHVRPRWAGMEFDDDGVRRSVAVPDALVTDGGTATDAVNVRASGSNLAPHLYPRLLRRAARALGVTGYLHVDDLHRTSNVQDIARYLRVDRHDSGPIHARDGPLQSLAHVLEGDREGYRKLVQNDETERGENLPGYYHTVTLGPDRVRQVMPDHRLPIEAKHYYAREALDRDPDDPLRHPKLEAAYQTSRWNGTLHWHDLDDALDELDDWLYSIVQDSLGEAALRADGGPYVEDAVWSPANESTTAAPVNLNLTEVRHEQERVVYKHLADGMSPTQQETLKTLVTDGGRVSPRDVADENDRHVDTVYRALQDMHDLVDHTYGEIQLQSTYLSELVADALEEAESAVSRATSAAAEAAHTAERGLDDRTSAFLAWQSKFVDRFRDRDTDDGGVALDLGRVDGVREVRRLLREGLDLWSDMNRDEAAYRMGDVKWRVDGEEGVRHGTIWQLIRGSTTSGGTKVVRSRQ